MSDRFNGEYGTPNRSDASYSRYSRNAGIQTYRRKRRQGNVFKIVVLAMVVIVVGGAVLMFGRHVFGDLLPAPSTHTAEERAESKEEKKVQPAEITLVAAGDVIMNGSVVESGLLESGAYDFDHLFSPLTDELSRFDVRIVNQETNLPSSKFGFGNTTPLNAPQELGRAEVDAGFNVICRATDHTMDNGTEGLHNELQWWDSEYPDLPLLGIAEPDGEQYPNLNNYVDNVYVFEKDGFKVAILNHTWGVSDENAGIVSALAEDKIVNDVNRARELGAEMIIACPHWGMENTTEANEEETSFAQIYASCGVDVVIGTHPRVLQRVEVIHGEDGRKTVCYYSLGCLTSSLSNSNLVGGLAEITLSKDETGACSISSATLKPVVTHRATGEDYATYLLADYDEELSYSGWDYLTRESANASVAEVLGDGYDEGACEYRVEL